MKKITLWVSNMTCDGCEATIRKALLRVDGIEDAWADHKTSRVWLQVNESRFRIAEADRVIRQLGYEPGASQS